MIVFIGNRILNTCPKDHSCGTHSPVWTNASMPVEVGKLSFIYAYRVLGGDCTFRELPLEVIRCSMDTDCDYIYRYSADYITGTCSIAFCGMS